MEEIAVVKRGSRLWPILLVVVVLAIVVLGALFFFGGGAAPNFDVKLPIAPGLDPVGFVALT